MNGKTLAIEVNVPTRFATLFFVLESILRSESAIKLMVAHEDWAEASSGSTNADVFDNNNNPGRMCRCVA
jgi:hypothetical protein